MTESYFTVVFDGSALENSEIDVQELAFALLAMGGLIEAANSEINGDRAQVSVKVRATSQGSFEVDLSLIQSLIESTKALFSIVTDHKDEIATANDLIHLLFGTSLLAGLFPFIKWLRGRKPEKIEHKEGGTVHVHIGDSYFVTHRRTIQLAENIKVREQAKKVVASLSREGIDTIKIKRNKQDFLEVGKGEASYFEYEQGEEELANETRKMTLQIVSLSFKEDNKWRVTDGSDPFSVDIEDMEFLNQIANNEIAFSKGDYLVCLVRERQLNTAKGLKKERSITKVEDHRPAMQQLRLL